MSSFNLGTVQDVSFNGVPMGYSKIHLNGVRIWEKYQVNTPYQAWISSGYDNVTISGWYYLMWRHNGRDSYILAPVYSGNWSNSTAFYGDGMLIGFRGYDTNITSAELLSSINKVPSSGGWTTNYAAVSSGNYSWGSKIQYSKTNWVDTSHYETQYQMIDTWYY
jgi:hypothetical protein